MEIRVDKKKGYLYSVLPYIILIFSVILFIVDEYGDGFWANVSIFFYSITLIALIYILYKNIVNIKNNKGVLTINEDGILDKTCIYSLETLLSWSYVDKIICKGLLGGKYIAIYLNEAGRKAYIRKIKSNMSHKKSSMMSINSLVSPVGIRTITLQKSQEEIYELMLSKLNEHRKESD